jgi:hypothetical protein
LDAGEHDGILAGFGSGTTGENGRETPSKFPPEGAVLEGGEEGVQFGEVDALRGLLALNGFDDGGEILSEEKRGERYYD